MTTRALRGAERMTTMTTTKQKFYATQNKRAVDQLRAFVASEFPSAALVHGWRHDGPGVALYGWHLQYATGACTFLGATAKQAMEGRQ